MKTMLRGAALACALVTAVAPMTADAKTYVYYDRYGHRHYTHSWREARAYNARYEGRRDDRRCRREGTKGAVIGGVGGAVLGGAIGHNALGAVLGGGAGALAGHQIAKSHCES